MQRIEADIVIIGAGASGMAAGIGATLDGITNKKIIILEKNEKTGKKIYITGKGRCNFTNLCDLEAFLPNVVNNPKFLFSSLRALSPSETVGLFDRLGLESKVERGNRVFPKSDKSSDVIKALTNTLRKNNCEIHLNTNVLNASKADDYFEIYTSNITYVSKRLIIATGGLSYPLTGSTGDGLRFAQTFGHTITKPVAALTSILLEEKHELEGLSLKNVRADIIENDRVVASEFGEMLFTRDGVSGPIILSLSSRINRLNPKALYLSIDLKSALSVEVLDKRLLRDFDENINKQFKNSLDALVPKRLASHIIKISGITDSKPLNQITKQERATIISLLKGLRFKILGLDDITKGVVFSGGINVKEINPNTLESKLVDGLYFSGELIDVDAFTGGYNMQIAFSTGYLAGISANKSLTNLLD